MSNHYDEVYEGYADAARKREKQFQAECLHLEWAVLYTDRNGNPKKTYCQRCKLVHTVY